MTPVGGRNLVDTSYGSIEFPVARIEYPFKFKDVEAEIGAGGKPQRRVERTLPDGHALLTMKVVCPIAVANAAWTWLLPYAATDQQAMRAIVSAWEALKVSDENVNTYLHSRNVP